MVTATRRLEAVPTDTISEQASTIRFSTVLLTCVTAVFFAAGWVIGAFWWATAFIFIAAWRAVSYSAIAVRYGYRTGAHIPVAPAQQPEAARRGRPGPGGTLIEE
jgi:hypothetical protein